MKFKTRKDILFIISYVAIIIFAPEFCSDIVF